MAAYQGHGGQKNKSNYCLNAPRRTHVVWNTFYWTGTYYDGCPSLIAFLYYYYFTLCVCAHGVGSVCTSASVCTVQQVFFRTHIYTQPLECECIYSTYPVFSITIIAVGRCPSLESRPQTLIHARIISQNRDKGRAGAPCERLYTVFTPYRYCAACLSSASQNNSLKNDYAIRHIK